MNFYEIKNGFSKYKTKAVGYTRKIDIHKFIKFGEYLNGLLSEINISKATEDLNNKIIKLINRKYIFFKHACETFRKIKC